MDSLLRFVIYFVGSGSAFFVGAALILVGLTMSLGALSRAFRIARNLIVLFGGILVAVSAAPLEWWIYGLLAATTGIWLPMEWCKTSIPPPVLGAFRLAVLTAIVLALAFEMPFHFMPSLPRMNRPVVYLIGDSVSAGMSESEKGTWPKLLAAQQDIEIRDFSKAGATVKSARKQGEKIGNETGLVLLEIGGNDVLGSTSTQQFEEQLDLLLAEVCRKDRTVVMLALPLPPFANQFGLIQRRLSNHYRVKLVPQRLFAEIITTSGATVDGIHLTPLGHQNMADTIWELIRPAYAKELSMGSAQASLAA